MDCHRKLHFKFLYLTVLSYFFFTEFNFVPVFTSPVSALLRQENELSQDTVDTLSVSTMPRALGIGIFDSQQVAQAVRQVLHVSLFRKISANFTESEDRPGAYGAFHGSVLSVL